MLALSDAIPNAEPMPVMNDITRLLESAVAGESPDTERLFALVYDELRLLARQKLARERPGQTLQATALVHEAYVRLVGGEADRAWEGRGHFFAAAAEAMRRILVENARRKGRVKHGGGRRREAADLDALEEGAAPEALLDLHEALERFAEVQPIKAKLVELKFFGGLTLEQAAEILGISLSTADRSWRYARAWLHEAIGEGDPEKNLGGG